MYIYTKNMRNCCINKSKRFPFVCAVCKRFTILQMNIYAKSMELNFSKIVNREKKQVEMFLYGTIGEQDGINGHWFAREMNWLAKEYDEIKVRINSNGGNITEGLSIVSEMMASPAYVVAHVDGIAASMAAVILAAADRVTMNDYAKVMIHSPYFADENGKAVKELSTKDKKSLAMAKQTLGELLGKRGIAEDVVAGMMKTDTWYTSAEAQTAGLVDEVIVTGRKELAAVEPLRLVAMIEKESFTNNKKMEKIIAKLGLPEGSTEEAIVAAIEKLGTPADSTKVLVDKMVEAGKKNGRITEQNEARVRKLAETDMEMFAEFIGFEAKPADEGIRLSEVIAELKKEQGAAAVSEKDFDWYQKHDPDALAQLEVKEPEKFKKLFDAYKAKF